MPTRNTKTQKSAVIGRRSSKVEVLPAPDLDDLEELSKTPEEFFADDEDKSQNYHTFEEFLGILEIDDKDSETIIESSNLSRSFMETMLLDSKIHGNLSSFRSGGAAPLRTDPTKTPKSMKIKSKSYSSPTTKLPFLGGVIPAHKIFNRLTSDRKPDPKALQDKDANGEKVQLTKTPVELLRLITKGDVEIEKIDKTTPPPKLILKYKENEGSIEFKGRFVLTLDSNGQDRKQEYDRNYGDKLDPLQTLDQYNETNIHEIISTNSPLINNNSEDLKLVTEFFTNHANTEMPICYTTEEPYNNTQETLKLEVLASNGKAITTDVDIATRSIPLDLKLPKHLVDKHLYEPINMSEPGVVKKIQNKRKLLNYTMQLFEHVKQNYCKEITNLEQEIQNIQSKAKKDISTDEQTDLRNKLTALDFQKTMLLASPISKLMTQEQQGLQINNGSRFGKIRQIFNRIQQPKLNFSDLFLSFERENAKQHFTELAGIITPFEFLQNILNNCIAKTESLQHGTDIRNPAEPEDAEQTMFFQGRIFRTKDDKQRMKLYLADQFFEQQFIPVNPKADMKVWGKLVEKQLASPQHKAKVSTKTKLAYFNHLMTTMQLDELSRYIEKLSMPNYKLLDPEQKKEFLEYVQQNTEQTGDSAIHIHQAIQKAQAKLKLSSSGDPRQQAGFFGTILTTLQQQWQPNAESSNSANIEGINGLQSPSSRAQERLQKQEMTYSPRNHTRGGQ